MNSVMTELLFNNVVVYKPPVSSGQIKILSVLSLPLSGVKINGLTGVSLLCQERLLNCMILL